MTLTVGEITARYDTRSKDYHLFIDKSALPDAGWSDEIAFFDHAKKIIHFFCQAPGLTFKQLEAVIKICHEIQDTLNDDTIISHS